MPLLAQPTDVFILRIWREPRQPPDAPPVWRGVVEHVPSGTRRHFAELEQAMIFIVEQLVAGEQREP
jgi:hypothetical protein